MKEYTEEIRLLIGIRDKLDYLDDFGEYFESLDKLQKLIDKKIKSI